VVPTTRRVRSVTTTISLTQIPPSASLRVLGGLAVGAARVAAQLVVQRLEADAERVSRLGLVVAGGGERP
jgi:hypothetical protein